MKIRGRLGEGPDDDKEIRILNRIVRVLPNGVSYEADPRHAELLAKSLGLTECKPVTTPGIKSYVEDESEVKYGIAEDADEAVVAAIGQTKLHRGVSSVQFADDIEYYEVVPYEEIYGRHPRQIVATRHGWFKTVSSDANPFTGKSESVMRHRKMMLTPSRKSRSAILQHVLDEGPAWEVRTSDLLNMVCVVKKKASRIGAKAVKRAEQLESEGHLLNAAESTTFRALAARANYLAMDRPELAFSSKELCREFAAPSRTSWEKLKRLARYLVGRPRLVMWYGWQVATEVLDAYTDTDFAGCRTTRRSTSGGIAMRGTHPIKHWSVTQSTVTLSSGEAELGGITKGASIGLGLQSVARDLGFKWELTVHTDATAAIGICRRKGLGKIRHLAVADLWVQDRVRSGDFKLTKVLGSENPADILTKYVAREVMEKHIGTMSCFFESGRAASAPVID